MTLLTNPVAVPFFDRIPRRLLPAVQRAFERADTSRDPVTEQHKAFLLDIAPEGMPGPTLDEFRAWIDMAKHGHSIVKAECGVQPYEPVAKGAIERMFVGRSIPVPDTERRAEDYLRKVHAIIVAAVHLWQAKVDAGYSPESSETEDQIVGEAIAEWLAAEAVGWSQALNLPYAPGEVALRLLDTKDNEKNAKLLDVFSMHFQRELAVAIVERDAKGGAA